MTQLVAVSVPLLPPLRTLERTLPLDASVTSTTQPGEDQARLVCHNNQLNCFCFGFCFFVRNTALNLRLRGNLPILFKELWKKLKSV